MTRAGLQVHGARAAVFSRGGAGAASGAELSGVLRRQPGRREGVELGGGAGGGGGGVVASSSGIGILVALARVVLSELCEDRGIGARSDFFAAREQRRGGRVLGDRLEVRWPESTTRAPRRRAGLDLGSE